MKVTYRWLGDFVELAAAPAEVARRFTEAGLEVESMEPVAPPFSGVIVGRVLDVSRHPDAEKLSVCQVTTDGQDRLQIICGAPNVRAGLNVAVAMVGAKLPNEITIKRAKLRGLESAGMLCSARELGLGQEYDGIMELPEDLALSTELRQALDLDDTIFEINATPNRGDCMSVFGLARDYAAAQARRYVGPVIADVLPESAEAWSVSMSAPEVCPLLASRVVRSVRPNAQAPPWLRERLRRVGVNSISAIVDITNYVMLELGQPMHAYDLAKIEGAITARAARAQETITLLDDKEYTLDADFLVIADQAGAIGLAGIMGGRRTAISESTTDILLEAAHFVPAAVIGRARRLGLFTDAGQRFERGVDPALPNAAIERATALLLECVGGVPGATRLSRATHELAASAWINLRRTRVERLLGAPIADEEIVSVLNAISTQVELTAEGWSVYPPSHRFDLRIEADLIEEVARLRGFDSIREQHATIAQIPGLATEAQVDTDRILAAMVDRGYREVITYSFVDPVMQRLLFPNLQALSLSNPIAADLGEMRVSLWPGLVHAGRDNLRRQQSRVRLFELGKKYVTLDQELCEVESLAGIATGLRWPEQWGTTGNNVDFFDVKGDVLEVLGLAGNTKSIRFEPASNNALRPGRAARIFRDATPVGWIGELHPQLLKALNLPQTPVLFEVDTELAFIAKPISFKRISKFPSVRRDLAIIVDENLQLAVLRENVSVSASGLLSELRLFDIYRGPGVDSGRKSVALGLILQDSSRTLTDVDADAVVTAVVTRLRDELSATIRD